MIIIILLNILSHDLEYDYHHIEHSHDHAICSIHIHRNKKLMHKKGKNLSWSGSLDQIKKLPSVRVSAPM